MQFAGAAQSLGAGAILVNPWNITEVATSIAQALNMPADEREKRHKHNFAHVTSHTAQEWAETFVRYACNSVVTFYSDLTLTFSLSLSLSLYIYIYFFFLQ
jgi:trehalose 6-phosphate synthase/phosphatase